MTIAPYYVIWAFSLAAMLLISLGLAWLVIYDIAAAIARRLWMGDLVALWLGYAACYHLLFFVILPYREVLDDPFSVWVIWGVLALYAALRLLPTPLRRPQLLLAVAIAGWGWSIGAGYEFIDSMEKDAAQLEGLPEGGLQPGAVPRRALLRILFHSRLESREKQLMEELLSEPARPGSEDSTHLEIARTLILPELAESMRLEIRRLHTYQGLQIVLLIAGLLGWGFGRRPEF